MPRKESPFIKKYLWGSIVSAVIIGIIMIILTSFSVHDNLFNFITTFGCNILIAGASLSSGGFLGFLFGIPSILQDPKAKLKYNDNLVQISDWLTKIIVGVGLTQLYQIPSFVKRVGVFFATTFGNDDWGRNIAIAIIGYFLVLGFLMIYFWTKTDYSTVMKEQDDEFNEQLQAKEQAVEDKKKMAEEIIQKETQKSISNSSVVADASTTDQIKQAANQPLNQKLDELKAVVGRTLPTKPVKVPDDPQKNRWGGKQENNGRKISAKVSKNNWQNLFDVVINVSNIDNTSITEPVAIFIHDSYQITDNVVYVMPDAKGVDELSLLAYEAFTVGALFADGTELELDLNVQEGYPVDFYWTDKAKM
jgi:hypothetical protein